MKYIIDIFYSMKCPRCEKEAEKTGKTWKYHVYDVEQYDCNKCQKKYNAYYRDGKFAHTIPK